MSSISTTDERVDRITSAVKAIIQREIAVGTMTEIQTNMLLNQLIRIRKDIEFLDDLINIPSIKLTARWGSNDNAMSSAVSTVDFSSIASPDATSSNPVN